MDLILRKTENSTWTTGTLQAVEGGDNSTDRESALVDRPFGSIEKANRTAPQLQAMLLSSVN